MSLKSCAELQSSKILKNRVGRNNSPQKGVKFIIWVCNKFKMLFQLTEQINHIYLIMKTSPAGINLPVLKNLDPMTQAKITLVTDVK